MVSKPRSLKRISAVFGLALVAAAFTVGGLAPASALAAAPQNIAPPTVSPNPPEYGKNVTTSNGEWNGKPTSYTYAWSRCNASGVECTSIAGATSSTYTPTEADFGHSFISSVTAKNSEGSTTALSKATKVMVLPPEYWYACKNLGAGAGVFEDAACSKEGGIKPAYAWSKLTASTKVALKAGTALTLSWTLGGVTFTAKCTSQSGTGTIDNPSGATVSSASNLLSGCSITKPAESGCHFKGNALWILNFSGINWEWEAKPALKFTPSGNFAEFSLEGCSGGFAFLNGSVLSISGWFSGLVNNATSSIEFTQASTAGLTMSGQPVSLVGTSKIETTAGEVLKLAP